MGELRLALADLRRVTELRPAFKDELRLRLLSGKLPIGDTVVVVADRTNITAQGKVVDTALRGTALLRAVRAALTGKCAIAEPA